jgi:hypothetical protein
MQCSPRAHHSVSAPGSVHRASCRRVHACENEEVYTGHAAGKRGCIPRGRTTAQQHLHSSRRVPYRCPRRRPCWGGPGGGGVSVCVAGESAVCRAFTLTPLGAQSNQLARLAGYLIPKSAILQWKAESRSTFRAAMSRWTNRMRCRYVRPAETSEQKVMRSTMVASCAASDLAR